MLKKDLVRLVFLIRNKAHDFASQSDVIFVVAWTVEQIIRFEL